MPAGTLALWWPVVERRAPMAAPLRVLGPGQSGGKVGALWGGSRRARPARGGCPNEEKRPFPNSSHMPLFFNAAFGGGILSAASVCAGMRPRSSSPRAPVPQDPRMPPGGSSTLRVPAGHPSLWDVSGCSSMVGGGTSSLGAPLQGTPPQHSFSLSPPACFLRFCPYFSRQKQPPSPHLPSLSRSQRFFPLFSASCYPGAKNNKEFTALDLELGAERSFVLCQQSPGRLLCIPASPFPWGCSSGTPAGRAVAARDAASRPREG